MSDRSRRQFLVTAGVAIGAAVLPGAAKAACQVDLQPVAFGTVDLEHDSTGTGKVAVTCGSSTSFSVAIGGSSSGRKMQGSGNGRLTYDLYQDPSYATRWGSGNGNGGPRSGTTSTNATTSLTIYGVVPRQTGIAPGQYVDQVEVTLSF